jgi:hypothetical protein
MPYIVNLAARRCGWCGIDSDSARVIECPACGRDTCHECVKLFDESTLCKHTTPGERHVLTRQDWNDDPHT